MEILVRNNMQPGDLGQIVALHGTYYHAENGFDETFEPYVAIPLAEFVLRKSNAEKIWIVEYENQVKGCIAIVKADENTGQLRWYVLDKSIQGLGYGKKLIDAAIEFAWQAGYSKIVLWTISEQEKAISIYKKYGFKLVTQESTELWGKIVNEQCYELVRN